MTTSPPPGAAAAAATDIPSPPSLLSDHVEPDPSSTNTHALILPHQSLFLPPILQRLKDHYEQYGAIAHWAPVRGFGRVIIVWHEVAGAEMAKRKGDWLKLDVDLPAEENHVPPDAEAIEGEGGGIGISDQIMDMRGLPEDGSVSMDLDQVEVTADSSTTFKRHRRRKSKGPAKGITLRLHPLPFTPLNPDPSSFHLAPPHAEKNFLISPPGSPPEGWEPIVEDAPNASTLAEDLQRALESLQLNGRHRRRGSKEVILEEGGVRVEVEDCTVPIHGNGRGGTGDDGEEDMDEEREQRATSWSTEERVVVGGASLWAFPDQGNYTPSGRTRIAPTARPPL